MGRPVQSDLGEWLALGHKLRVVTLPEDDDYFARDVHEAVQQLNGSLQSGPKAITELLRQLLPHYPKLTIHQKHALASFESDSSTWYAYRDGSWLI
jgi:hypothetical protein